MIIKITTEVNIRNCDIDDIICTAFEGGITYWCYHAQSCMESEWMKDNNITYCSEIISHGGDIALTTEDGDYILTPHNFYTGLRMAIKEGIVPLMDDENARDTKCIDTCDIDSDIADTIIQYALFGKLVYC